MDRFSLRHLMIEWCCGSPGLRIEVTLQNKPVLTDGFMVTISLL